MNEYLRRAGVLVPQPRSHTHMRTHDITRLPKWAQDEMTRLASNVEHWKKKATAGPEDSNTFIQNFGFDDTPLGDSPMVKFVLPDGSEITARVGKSDRSVLHLSTVNGAMHVVPQAANSIRLRVGDY